MFTLRASQMVDFGRGSSPQCASAMKIVRPLESIADTHSQLQPALLRLSAMISQYFTELHSEPLRPCKRIQRIVTQCFHVRRRGPCEKPVD